LILLDVMMPGLDGLELLRSLRRSSLVPVIMLTAKTRQMDRVAGLDAGADDYLPKPFGPEELLARIRAVLRRTSQIPETTEPLEVGGLTLIPGSREVRLGQVLIGLTSIEYDLFEILIRSAGRTVTREALTAAIYRRQVSPFDRAVDMHVSNLRKKLGAKGALIRTIRGLGYLFSTGRGPDESGVTEPSDGPTRTPHPNPPPLRGEGTRKDDGSLASDSVSPCGEGSGWGVEGLATPGASATIKESGS
jgi:two-component system response regulator CpxR